MEPKAITVSSSPNSTIPYFIHTDLERRDTNISYTNYTPPVKRLKTPYCVRDGKVSAL